MRSINALYFLLLSLYRNPPAKRKTEILFAIELENFMFNFNNLVKFSFFIFKKKTFQKIEKKKQRKKNYKKIKGKKVKMESENRKRY